VVSKCIKYDYPYSQDPICYKYAKVYRNGYVGGAAIAALIGGTTKQEDSQDGKEGKGHNTT